MIHLLSFIDISSSGFNLFMIADATCENDSQKAYEGESGEEADCCHEVALDLINQLLEATGILVGVVVGPDSSEV